MFRSPLRKSLRPLLGLVGLSLVACGGGGGAGGTSGGDGGIPATRNLEIRLRDKPVEAADNVFVTIESVEVFRTVDGVDLHETVASTPAQYDLLELQHGVEAVLGGGEFPPGDYHSIRLIVSKDSKDDIKHKPANELKNYIVIDGVAHPLVVPGGAKRGIKLGRNFTVAEEGTTVLTLDFDVRQSVKRRGCKGVYSLKPRIKIVANQEDLPDAALAGTVTTTDGTGLPAGTVVSVQQDGAEVTSAQPDPSTGEYSVTDLPDGSYDLVVIAPGYSYDSEEGVQVTGGQGGTHDFAVSPVEAGAVYGTVTPAGEDVTVHLLWNGFVVASMDADAVDGTYLFDSIPAGEYVVVASNGTSTASSAATVAGGAGTQVDLDLP